MKLFESNDVSPQKRPTVSQRYQVLLLALLCFSLLTADVSGQDLYPDARGQQLAGQLQEMYKQVKNFQGVQARYQSGVLTLSGQVKTQISKARAERIASHFKFAYIQNDLLIDRVLNKKLETQRASLKDEEIESKLSVIFSKIPKLNNVKVEVNQGIVSLSGKVYSEEARKQSETIAKTMSDVVFVDNQIADIDDFREQLAPSIQKISTLGEKVLIKLPILAIAGLLFFIFVVLAKFVKRFSFGFKKNKLLQSLVQQVVQIVILVIGLFISLDVLDATTIVGAILGSAGIMGLAVGFAFRDIVENYLTSLLLSVRQPFEQDDFVEINGLQGTIVKLTTSETILMTEEGNHLRFPNSVVFKSTIINYTRNPLRRLDVVLGIGLMENLLEVQEQGVAVLRSLPGILAEPVPTALTLSLDDSCAKLQFMGWVDQRSHSFLRVQSVVLRSIKDRFDRLNIEMPYPTQTIEVLALDAKEIAERKSEKKDKLTSAPPLTSDVSVNRELDEQVAKDRKNTGEKDLLAP